MRVAEPFRGSAASLSEAANRSSIGRVLSPTIAFNRARRPEYLFASLRLRLFFSIELVFAIRFSWVSASEISCRAASLPEREIESRQQRACLLIGTRGRADGYVEAPNIGDPVVVDFRKHDVLPDPERIIAAPIEALRIQAAEVANARQSDIDQPVDELVHPSLAQRHLAADRLTFAQFVSRNRFPRLRDHRLLPGDQREMLSGRVDFLAVVHRLTDAHVDHDLLDRRHLHSVLVTELLNQLLANDIVVMGLETRRDADLRGPRLFRLDLRALIALRRLCRLLCFGLRLLRLLRLIGLVGLLGVGLLFGVSHRSRLPNA